MTRRLRAAALIVTVCFACAREESAPASGPPGEPGVVNLIEDDSGATPGPDGVPGAGVEYGKYAPGSR